MNFLSKNKKITAHWHKKIIKILTLSQVKSNIEEETSEKY